MSGLHAHSSIRCDHISCGLSISFRMSATFQAVILGPSLTPLGNRPALMPAHQVDRETGNTERTAGSRMYPSFGILGFSSSEFIWSLLLAPRCRSEVSASGNFVVSTYLRLLCLIALSP